MKETPEILLDQFQKGRSFVARVLEKCIQLQLETEVIYCALKELKEDSTISIEIALERGMKEWDVNLIQRTSFRVILEISDDEDKEILKEKFNHDSIEVLEDGRVVSYLSVEEYDRQLRRPDDFWYCPVTKLGAQWDEDWFESQMEECQKKDEIVLEVITYFKMSSNGKTEVIKWQKNPTDEEVDNYLRENYGEVYRWWRL